MTDPQPAAHSGTPAPGEATYLTAALYRFVSLPDCAQWRDPLQAFCESHGVKGTLLLASEGIN
ncbi:MAG: hypothetical protein Q7U45_09640, partial [Burkholderiaceae bacterium]|nr:hypothetical protein [Burkholderiaceae bacterium]